MKNIHLLIALAIFAFSACSNDNEEPSKLNLAGCLLKMNGANFECIEEDAYYGSKQVCDGMKGEWVNSCPPGGTKCEAIGSDGIKFVATFYTEYNLCSNPSSSSGSKPSSNSNSESGVCYITNTNLPNSGDLKMCAEGITEPLTRSDCEEIAEESGYDINFQNSCPSGQKLKCLIEDEDGAGYMYVYGQVVTSLDLTCDDLFGDDYSEPSSSSSYRPSSSSNFEAGVCYVNNFYGHGDLAICAQSAQPITSSNCIAWAPSETTANTQASCPSAGRKLTCSDDAGYIYYVYGQEVTDYGLTCDYYLPGTSSNSGTACYILNESFFGTVCIDDMSSSECDEWAEGAEWTMRNSCPPGYKLDCSEYGIYFYDHVAGSTCNLFE